MFFFLICWRWLFLPSAQSRLNCQPKVSEGNYLYPGSSGRCLRVCGSVYHLVLVPKFAWDIKGSTWVQIIYAMSHVTFYFSLCPHFTFYKTLTSLSTVFIKGHVESLQLLKWPCHTSFLLTWSPRSHW